MNQKYFNRTLIAIGEHVFEHSQSDVKEITIKVEDKKTKEEIKMFKPQWSIAIECILDHCRTIYDILPEEAGICVALQHDLNNCSMMNQWNWEQQNFLQISNNLSIEIEKHFGKLSENKKMTSDMMKTEDFERFSKLLLNQLFSQSEIQANEKNQTNIKNAFRVLYVTKCCFDLNEYENLRKNVIIPLVESFTKVFENLKMEIKLNKINNNVEINNILLNLDEEELNNITCTLDIIIPTVPDILQNHLNINNNHNNTNNNIEVGYKSQTFEISTGQLRESTIFDRIKIWSIEKDILGKVIRERIAQRQYGFILIAVQGIPMRDSEETNNYDVLLACKGLPIELTQDVTLYGSSICLRWVRADPKRSIEHLYTTKSVHRITPVFPYTLPTLCLMKHLMTKKPVALIFESRYNLHHKHSPTHLILQHGQDVYLHVLHLNKVFQPYSVSLSDETTNVKYKINEFMDIVNKHLLRINVKKNTTLAIEDVTNGNTTTTNNNNNTGTNNNSVVNVKQQENQMYSLMKHNHFIYRVPSSIERYTRVFSLTVDESSILFNESAKENYPTLFNQILNPLLRIILNRSQEQLTEQEQLDIDKLFTALYQCAKNNDEHIFPELRNDHTKRWNTYRKLWSELRSFVTSMSYKEFGLNIMERLWPQFYYDKNQNETDSSTKRSKRTIEVQRDRYGNIVFPIQLGALTVLALGKVVFDRPAFHTEKYIWPVGYKSTRYYTSVKDTNKRCLYTCEIKDGGDAPIFVLISEDNPNEVIEAPSATAAWTVIVKQINKIKSEESGKRVFTNVSGPEYYGLAHPTVMKLISQLPNAEKVHRPNAPHQPIKPEVSPNTNVTTNTATGVTEINDNSEDENAAFTSSTTNPSTTITQTTNPTNENVEVSSDIQIKQKRLKRDESVYYERDLVRNDIQKVQWRPNNSLLNFYQERFDKLSPKSLDGESEGQKALYSYLNLNQQEHFSRGGSGSVGDTNTSNANQQGHGNMSYGGNRHRKFGHQQKRKFMYH